MYRKVPYSFVYNKNNKTKTPTLGDGLNKSRYIQGAFMQALKIVEQYVLSGYSYVCMYRNIHTLYVGKHHPSSVSKAHNFISHFT